jgi:hypothetical protein
VTDIDSKRYVDECGWSYICNNGFDAAGKILEFMANNIAGYQPLQAKSNDWKKMGELFKFD